VDNCGPMHSATQSQKRTAKACEAEDKWLAKGNGSQLAI